MTMRGEKRKRKAKEPPPIPDRVIGNEMQLREMLKNFDPSLDSQVRKTLIEGFEKVRNRIEANDKIKSMPTEYFGRFKPAKLQINNELYSLDNFIRKRMGGERDGLVIKWHLQGQVYTYYPWTGELTKDERNS